MVHGSKSGTRDDESGHAEQRNQIGDRRGIRQRDGCSAGPLDDHCIVGFEQRYAGFDECVHG
ncbi:hypothetical protein D3C84_1023210 [compost metagenome]